MQKEFDKGAQQLESEAQLFEKNAQGIGKNTQSIGQSEQILKQSEQIVEQNGQTIKQSAQLSKQSEQFIDKNEQLVKQNMQTVRQNKEIIEQSAQPIGQGEQPLKQDGQTIGHGAQASKYSEQIVEQNGQTIKQSVQAVRQNKEIIEQSAQTVEQGEQFIDKNEQLVKQNMQAVRQNKEIIEQSAQPIGQGEQLSKRNKSFDKDGRQVFLTAVAKWNQSEGLPKLLYTPMLFRRRLSALTKITIEVLNRLFTQYPKAKQYPITFVSRRNERNVQFDVNKSLISEGEVRPATFSLSVFNTAVSQASIYFGIKSPYTVIDTGEGRVSDALRVAASSILTGDSEGAVFVFAEEALRDEYKGLAFGGAVGYALVLESCFESSCNKARNIDKFLWGGGDE